MVTPDGLPFLRPSAAVRRIEAFADACLEFCCAREKPSRSTIPLPVPVERWIEAPLGIQFGVEDLGEYVLGAAAPRIPRIRVSDRITNEGRFRFTCAHELGHVILHRRYAETLSDTDVGYAPRSEFLEWQADRFAAAFLMPLGPLLRELVVVTKGSGLDLSRCVAELTLPSLESEWLWRKYILPRLGTCFGVSRTALVRRFSEFRFKDRRPFLLPELSDRLVNPGRRPLLSRFVLVDGFPVRP